MNTRDIELALRYQKLEIVESMRETIKNITKCYDKQLDKLHLELQELRTDYNKSKEELADLKAKLLQLKEIENEAMGNEQNC